jgi:hypothetical protein
MRAGPLLKPYSKKTSRTYRLFLSRSESWLSQQYYTPDTMRQPPLYPGTIDFFKEKLKKNNTIFKSATIRAFLRLS